MSNTGVNFGFMLIGMASLFIAVPLGCILWFVFARTINMNPPDTHVHWPKRQDGTDMAMGEWNDPPERKP